MKEVFKDPKLQMVFLEDGFVTVPFLNLEEVAELKSFYEGLEKEAQTGFHASMFQPDPEYRRKVNEKLIAFTKEKYASILHNFYPLYGNFMVKESGAESEMKMHQDWTYVDEDQFVSLAIWFPLIDIGPNEGCVSYMPGNHKIENPYRGPGVKCPYDELDETIREKYLRPVPLKAGEAVLWDHRIVHWSPPNMAANPRIAATLILVPEKAPVFHFYTDSTYEKGKVEKFKVDGSFYMNYAIGKKPEGVESVGLVQNDWGLLKESDIEFLLKEEKQIAKPSPQTSVENGNGSNGFFAKIKSLFS